MTATWTRTWSEPGHHSNMTAEYRNGPWAIRKEFYADGPSLFTWVVYHDDRGWVGEAHTLRAAKELTA